MPELAALQTWIASEAEEVKGTTRSPYVPWWIVALSGSTVATVPFVMSGFYESWTPLSILAAIYLVAVVVIVAAWVARDRRRTETVRLDSALDQIVHESFPEILNDLIAYWSEDALSDALGTKHDVICKAAWDYARLDAATDLPFWNSEDTSMEVAELRDGLLTDANNSVRRVISLALTPPARFNLTETQSEAIIEKSSSLIAEIADRAEKLATNARSLEGDSSDYLMELRALEAAKKEVDDLIEPPTVVHS